MAWYGIDHQDDALMPPLNFNHIDGYISDVTTRTKYQPCGVISGTALIRPDLPELKIWPFFWPQTEYVMGDGEANYMFLALAVDKLNISKQ